MPHESCRLATLKPAHVCYSGVLLLRNYKYLCVPSKLGPTNPLNPLSRTTSLDIPNNGAKSNIRFRHQLPDLQEEIKMQQPLQEFTIFPNLITELRLNIWTIALFNHPRIIEILAGDNNEYYTPTSSPPLLSTCQESRAIALQHYHLSFPSESHPAKIYFNPSLDTIFYPSWLWRDEDIWPSLTEETKNSILHLATEPLEWVSSGSIDAGDINGFPISEYMNLKSYYHIIRDCPASCWCSMGDLKPEKGVITFANVEVLGEDAEEPDSIQNEVIRQFRNIKERYPRWSVPLYLQGKMKRDGELAYYTDGNSYGKRVRYESGGEGDSDLDMNDEGDGNREKEEDQRMRASEI